jgi:DNA-binding winged helix-turn-helix (wHTH) protein
MPTPFRRETPSLPRSTTIAFDKFEVDARSGELRRNSSRIRLQAQPFQLLLLLLRNAGEVVTREEICSELWPADTFVDFEHSLAAAVNKVRDALGDSAESPKFIETLPKRGFSNEVGRLQGVFLQCWPPQDTPVCSIPGASIFVVRVFTLRSDLCRCIASV